MNKKIITISILFNIIFIFLLIVLLIYTLNLRKVTEIQKESNQNIINYDSNSKLKENEDGKYCTDSGYILTKKQLENIRMAGFSDSMIMGMPDSEIERIKDDRSLKNYFDFNRIFLYKDFIYNEEEKKLERDEIVSRAKEEIERKIKNDEISADGIQYMNVIRVAYDENNKIWEIKFGREVGDSDCFVAYISETGVTKYILYEEGI